MGTKVDSISIKFAKFWILNYFSVIINSNRPERGNEIVKIGDFRPETANFCITPVAVDATLSKNIVIVGEFRSVPFSWSLALKTPVGFQERRFVLFCKSEFLQSSLSNSEGWHKPEFTKSKRLGGGEYAS